MIFSSDNGGERWSKSWPLVGQKGDITEGGIRVPFILRWPAAVGGGQVCDEPSITMDWVATFLDAAGTTPHADFPLDGVSLLSWLTEGAIYPEHDLFWRIASQSAMRRGPLKYVQSSRPRPVSNNWPVIPGDHEMLYDVTVDGREAADIIHRYPDEAAAMRAELDKLNAELLPYPPDHRNAPHRAAAAGLTVSQPD